MATGSSGIIKVNNPKRSDIRIIRALIVMGAISMVLFIWWFTDPRHIGYAPVFWLLTFALLFKLVKMVHEWYHYWSPSVPVMPVPTRNWTVDVLTTACPGEPREMIIRTLKAMAAIRYPHTNYLCDEGDDPVLKQACKELGIIHVTRTIKIDAKAGNINNALKQATGEICVVLDPDHEPIPEFLDRVLSYFEDEQIGFVQCVQAYGNQNESFIARGAAEQTYHFYGPMMMCMNTYGTVQAIGANCTFRRAALDSIGGHAAGLSEDMHTAMQLHAKGWKSVYVPEILTRGLVPATLSSYYKQQLKWSRGTFELLFRTFPQLKKNFTWRQKIHYFTIPLYFLFGLINLIDIAIPLIALGLAEVPWEVNLALFGLYFLPLCGISLIVRLYAQRWLLEKHERGFHFAGGILRMATWWIFLIGFVYTIFKIKVPYIPTPKEDEHQNYVRLSLPNFITLIVALLFVNYGLSIDWTPYSIAMASYSCMTIVMLGFTVMMSQQKLLVQAAGTCRKIPAVNFFAELAAALTTKSQQVAYHFLRNGPLMLIIAVSLLFLSYSIPDEEFEADGKYAQKELGGFYLGTSFAGADAKTLAGEKPFNVIAMDQNWLEGETPFDSNTLAAMKTNGTIPYIRWNAGRLQDTAGGSISEGIMQGKYDDYLSACAAFFRSYREPVFISFPKPSHTDNPKQFTGAWQYLYTYFNELGISNLTWVWCPDNAQSAPFYPGEKFVDWLGVNCLNYAEKTSAKDWCSFSQLYDHYRKAYGQFQKPVMITALGAAAGPSQHEWLKAAADDIRSKFLEVKAAVLFTGKKHTGYTLEDGTHGEYVTDFGYTNGLRAEDLAELLQDDGVEIHSFKNSGTSFNKPLTDYSSRFISGSPGNFTLTVNDKPYYFRGVAYNTAHDWRDGNMPLSRRQVVADFKRIKAMGANTIRRYGTGIYDRNVLNIAAEHQLNVLYGFWFDPKIDFFADEEKVREYIEEVEEKVIAYKDHPAVIAWSLGNESWGLLKHRFAKPYLVKVRRSYIQMIEHLAQRIHELDPTRPVISCIEHEEYQLAGELVAFRECAPSIDAMGINSYYKEQITKLNHITWQFDSLRPYLVSEFGPAGYWDPKYNRSVNGSLVEQSDEEKADWYRHQWVNYVQGYKGYNIGGFAYCWHDRMEGSFTWFGLTDFSGRPKLSYYALKAQWTRTPEPAISQYSISVPSQLLPGQTYTLSVKGLDLASKRFEWRLLKDEYLDEVKNIEELEVPHRVALTVPEDPSSYRLYLHVSDEQREWVTTTSVPVKVLPKMDK